MIRKRISITVEYIVLIIASIISLFPLFWMFVSATNKSTDVLAGKLLVGADLVKNLRSLIETASVGKAMLNSTKYSILTTLGSVLICSIAGYAFEVF